MKEQENDKRRIEERDKRPQLQSRRPKSRE